MDSKSSFLSVSSSHRMQRALVPELQEVQDHFPDCCVIIGIDIAPDFDTVAEVQQYRTDHGITWTMAIDTSKVVSTAYGVNGSPWMFIIDINGWIQKDFLGLTDSADLISFIETLAPCPPEEVHDVEAVSQTVTDNDVLPGDVVSIDVTVRNNGDFTESFDVSCWYDSVLLGTIRVNDLAPGASTVVTFTWDTTGVPMNGYSIVAWADSGMEIDEVDEVNNECKMPAKIFVVPELPVGTILATLSMFAALVGYAKFKRPRIK